MTQQELNQYLAQANQLVGGYSQSVNPSWQSYSAQTPVTSYAPASTSNSGGLGGQGFSPLGPSLFGAYSNTTLQNQAGQSPTKVGSYYGTPVYSPDSGQITSKTTSSSGDSSGFDPFGLFSSPKTSWNSYIQNGQYYYQDPKKGNPVPIATVPGASMKPDKTAQESANNVQSLISLLPYIQNATAGQLIPQQQAQLAAAQATSGPYADLQAKLYAAYGPVMNQIGNDINAQNQLAGVQSQTAALQQGGGLTAASLALMRQANPEFFQQREQTANSLGNLQMQAMNQLNNGMSPTELRAIQQGLAREGTQRGTINAPSMTDTIRNAQQYGNAGFQRNVTAQNQLSQAISKSNEFLPASQVNGFNPVAQVTGSNLSNPGAGQFTGVNNNGQNAYSTIAGLTSGLGSNVNSLQQQNNQIDQQNKMANSWQNILSTVTSAASNIGSAVGSVYSPVKK